MIDKINHDHDDLLSLIDQPSLKYLDTFIKMADSRCLFLNEQFTKSVAAEMTAWLLYFDNQDHETPIYLYLNSDGGDGAALTNIYDVMQMIVAPIITINMGKCYSAAAFILAAGTKGQRYLYANSKILIHGLQVAFPSLLDDQIDTKTYYQFLHRYNDQILHILASHTGQTFEKLKNDCQKDMFLDAKSAIEYGLADYILT